MKKIPTLFVRDPENRSRVLPEVTPGCEWVLAGEGVATRKFDGTCVARLEGVGWVARREVKPPKTPPPGFILVEFDPATNKSVGWEPIAQSPFVKFWREAVDWHSGVLDYGTYELVGPNINGNPENCRRHVLVRHGAQRVAVAPIFDMIRTICLVEFSPAGVEGIVWHHPDGRMAKVKVRDFR